MSLSGEAMQKLVALEKALQSAQLSEKCESIMSFSELLNQFPLASFLNSALLKLSELFRSRSQYFFQKIKELLLNLHKFFWLKWKQLFEVLDCWSFQRSWEGNTKNSQQKRDCQNHWLFVFIFFQKLISFSFIQPKTKTAVLESNDPIARTLSLQILSTFKSMSEDLELQHKFFLNFLDFLKRFSNSWKHRVQKTLFSCLNDETSETDAAIEAACAMCSSAHFSAAILPKIERIISGFQFFHPILAKILKYII